MDEFDSLEVRTSADDEQNQIDNSILQNQQNLQLDVEPEIQNQQNTLLDVEPDLQNQYNPHADWSRHQDLQYQQNDKNNNRFAMAAISIAFIFVVGLCIFIALNLSHGVSFKPKKDVEFTTSDGSDPWKEIMGENAKDKNDKIDSQTDDSSDEANQDADQGYEKDINPYKDNSWKDKYVNHPRSQYKGEYYENFEDSIDENVSYKIRREFDETISEDGKDYIRTSYVQIEGDVPGVDSFNSLVRREAMYVAHSVEGNGDGKIKEGVANPNIYEITCYVTYNDEEIISVCITNADYSIMSINFNLKTGTFLDNTEILSIDQNFCKEFKERSEKQNGHVDVLDLMSDSEIYDLLTNDNSVIAFYTPIGFEIGFCYRLQDRRGWVTISMKDYKKYMNGI